MWSQKDKFFSVKNFNIRISQGFMRPCFFFTLYCALLSEDKQEKQVEREQGTTHGDNGNHAGLLCKEKGQWPRQQDVQEHLGNMHGKFFQERWQEFSNFQKNYAGKAQQDHEELGDAKPESSTNHTDVNESSLAAEKTKPNGQADGKSSIDSASVSGNKRAKGKVRGNNMHQDQRNEEEDNTGQWQASSQPFRRSGDTKGYREVEVEELLRAHKSPVTKKGLCRAKAQGKVQDQDQSGRDNQDEAEPEQHVSACSTHQQCNVVQIYAVFLRQGLSLHLNHTQRQKSQEMSIYLTQAH